MLDTTLHTAPHAHLEQANAKHIHKQRQQHKSEFAGTVTAAMPPSCCQIDLELCCCQAAHSTHRLMGPTLSGTVSKSLTSLRSSSLSCDPRPDRSTSGTSCLSPIYTNTLHYICHPTAGMQAAAGLSTHTLTMFITSTN